MRIAIGSDHAGFALKEKIKSFLLSEKIDVVDYGTHSPESVDYPDIAAQVANAIKNNEAEQGILLCKTGIGMSIVANKFSGIRAALCRSETDAQLAKAHNNANILVLSGEFTPEDLAMRIVNAFLKTEFEKGGRHERRIQKIHNLTGR